MCLSSEFMVGLRVSQSSSHSCWKQWWRRTCCSKKILLLLMWQVLFSFSNSVPVALAPSLDPTVFFASNFLANCFAPIIGWLADVRFGRYKIIIFGSIASLASILYSVFLQ